MNFGNYYTLIGKLNYFGGVGDKPMLALRVFLRITNVSFS